MVFLQLENKKTPGLAVYHYNLEYHYLNAAEEIWVLQVWRKRIFSFHIFQIAEHSQAVEVLLKFYKSFLNYFFSYFCKIVFALVQLF